MRRVLSTARVAARLLKGRVRGDFVEAEGVPIHFTDEGAGEPVLLVHGFAVNADLNWRYPGTVAALAREFRVIAMDLRGHGLSGKPHPPSSYGKQMVEDLPRLLDHLDVERAHVAGYSLGGFIALKLAATRPERLKSVAVLGAGWERPDNATFFGALSGLADQLSAGRGIGPLSANLGADRLRPSLRHTLWVKLVTKLLNDPNALIGVIRGTPELALSEGELEKIRAPVCSIVGANDPLLEGARALRGRVSALSQHVIRDADHVQVPMHPAFRRALLEFLRAQSGSATA